MIGQYCFALRSADGAPIPSMMAYRLYGWLLEQLPEDIGRQLHEQGEKPLSQYIRYDKAENRTLWVVSVFQGELYELLEPVLESISCIALRQTTLQAALLDKRCFASAQELVLYARELRLPSRVTIRFHTTSSFKQDGSYVIFPQERLLLRPNGTHGFRSIRWMMRMRHPHWSAASASQTISFARGAIR